jgi:protease I
MKEILVLLVAFLIFVSGCIGGEEVKRVDNKQVLMIIAPENFRDEEYFDTKQVLESYGAKVTTASSKSGSVRSMFGKTVNVENSLSDIDVKKYDAVVFIGGSGAEVYFDNKYALKIAEDAYKNNKVVAAICIAPVILANAGILDGKKATVWDGEYVDKLEEGGATYTGESVTKDGKIITANGPHAAKQFGIEIVKALNE